MTRIRVLSMMLSLALVAAACGDDGDNDEASEDPSGSTSDQEPLRIAVIPALTGPLAVFGEALNQSTQFAVDEVNANGGIDGRPVELVKLEADGTPENAVRLVERAVSDEDAPFVTGLITTPEVLAVSPQLESLDALLLGVTAKANDIAAQCNPRVFQIAQSNGQSVNALAEQLPDLDAESWAAVVVDQTTGVDMYETFREAAEAEGHTVADAVFVPPGTADYAQQIDDLQAEGADGLYVALFGGDGITFAQQAEQFGLFDGFESIVGTNWVGEPLFGAMGPAVMGVYNNLGYQSGIENAANEAFVEAWTEEFGDPPFYVQADQYLALQLLFAAVAEAGSVEPAEVAEALSGLSMEDSIVGPVEFRAEDNLLLRDEYVGQVVEADTESGIAWEIVSTSSAEDSVPPSACG